MKKHKKDYMDEQSTAAEEKQPSPEEGSASAACESAELAARLAEKEKEAAANYDKYLRAVAELDNYKKRAAKEKSEIMKYGKEDIIRDLLPFIDSIDRALEHADNANDIQSFKDGLKLMQEQLLAGLKKHGVEKIECCGKEFDPNFHDAFMQVDHEQFEDNRIISELERGYLLNGRLLRPSRVSVCKKINKNDNKCEKIVENVE
ncbi:MAG TPA: nucleotide exchange factor GrpE [Smithellaceae bacterium]|nr:nucleotide exchange factor GrpE [Smithellaceae bacterium]